MIRLRDRLAAASGGRLPDEGGAVVGTVLRRCSPGNVPAAKIGHYPDSANRHPLQAGRSRSAGGGKSRKQSAAGGCGTCGGGAGGGSGRRNAGRDKTDAGRSRCRTGRNGGRDGAGARHQTRTRLLRTQLLRTRARNSATGVRSLMHGARQPPEGRLGREPSRTRRPPRKDSAFRTKRTPCSGISPPERHFFGGLPRAVRSQLREAPRPRRSMRRNLRLQTRRPCRTPREGSATANFAPRPPHAPPRQTPPPHS